MTPAGPATTAVAIAAVLLGASAGLPYTDVAAKLGFGAAGFFGGIVSLAFLDKPSARLIALTALAGSAAGYYFAPMAGAVVSVFTGHEAAVAFIFGLIAIPLFGGVHALATRWRNDPIGIIALFRGGKKDGK